MGFGTTSLAVPIAAAHADIVARLQAGATTASKCAAALPAFVVEAPLAVGNPKDSPEVVIVLLQGCCADSRPGG